MNETAVKDGPKTPEQKYCDFTLYIVYDHRAGVSLEEIAEKLVKPILDESWFMNMIWLKYYKNEANSNIILWFCALISVVWLSGRNKHLRHQKYAFWFLRLSVCKFC